MVNILVVDDEAQMQPLMQLRFRRKIQANQYAFLFATSGREALSIIKNQPEIDVVLLDINMPDINGLALLGQLSELLPSSRTVMVSAYGDMSNIRTAMNRGAFDFVLKPINFQDLELTIDKTARHVGQLRESIRTEAIANLKARFFDNITHEFRTPLTLILAPAERQLQSSALSDATRQDLLTIERSAHHLLLLINQLLELSKLEAGKLAIVESPGNVGSFIGQLVESFRTAAEHKGILLSFQKNDIDKLFVFDKNKWEQIVNNLLSNALKFTKGGGNIDVEANLSDSMNLNLSVNDTGIGISKDKLDHVFDRFFQVDDSQTRAYGGSGIGLALVRELSNLLGGSAEVESQPGMGTSFRIRLPLKKLNESFLPAPEMSQASVPEPNLSFHGYQPGVMETDVLHTASLETDDPIVLLVEDNAELLEFMRGSLKDKYRVLVAENGREGLIIARRELPDVVISDVMMPEMDGYELVNQLKNDAQTSHISVILLTSRDAQNSRMVGLTAGADHYISKPFHLSELELRLQNLLNRQQKIRDHFQRRLSLTDTSAAISSAADTSAIETEMPNPFVQKLHNLIDHNLDNSEFGPEHLASEVAMSIRTLTRKLTTLTGISPARLIRIYRLRKAGEMLRAGVSISESAYAVGFDSPSYFATAFKEYFQKTPTEYVTMIN
ncbi:hybrid sensor histidine kinase/response regulator transcription factor [Dyadobacter arcticus]|uniref:histidine kinase n=1 Tax=Dyadobacter arcticus TaxID=1078754 RepID=A0ABX0UNL2_9BACT|nr:response regulator [Dyadobacter arcticus]NIJ54551.1 signal transduction histidine kinase/AraC-like DNA-binding protein [Dyadobacter arcticus]